MYDIMKKLFLLLAIATFSLLTMAQTNQIVWNNGQLLYGTPIETIDSLTYGEMNEIDTFHLILPRTIVKVVYDTVYVHDTIYTENVDDPNNPNNPSVVYPDGAIAGLFSISADKQVCFSQGNLKYQVSTNTWSFADEQYDMVYKVNGKIDSVYDVVDLFGWATSGYGDFSPALTSTNPQHYPLKFEAKDIVGTNYDWGYNAISNGGNQSGLWRVLSADEWNYLFNGRENAANLYAQAMIDSIEGMILLPDGCNVPSDIAFTTTILGWKTNKYTFEEWEKLEALGAVFLPVAGYRSGESVANVGFIAYYWTGSCDGGDYAHYYVFKEKEQYPAKNGRSRWFGHSVRLVHVMSE